LELGLIFSAYGIVALIAYAIGGPLADKFPARTLIVAALCSTALGGIYLATIPSYFGMKGLFAYWGLTTILLFWAALIRATRELGGNRSQGLAFGILDGGRGLVSALIGTFTVAVFAFLLQSTTEESSLEQRTGALQNVIYLMIAFIFIVAGIAFAFLPKVKYEKSSNEHLELHHLRRVLKLPTIWLQAIIIICAYIGYKALSDFSLYANEVLGYDEIQSARVGSLMLWVRPITAVSAGLLAMRFNTLRLINISFLLMLTGCTGFASGFIQINAEFLFFSAMVATCSGVFALRALYFSIFQEAHVPLVLTGTAVGFISLIGYTPDIFMGPLMGWLLDNNPGIKGHQYLFMVISAFTLLGLVTSIIFTQVSKRITNEYARKT
jgi:MFS family permease